MSFTWDERIVPILQQYGLDEVARVSEMTIDHNLITAISERWRRETHTFHLPTGESTVTLQDVSCLWGLAIDGEPVTGLTDDNWESDVSEAFGREDTWAAFRRPPGCFHMRIEWLCESWMANDGLPGVTLPTDADEVQILYYARAYMMDLLGSIMFPDHSGRIYTMFVQIILAPPKRISWASAVLAYLYRGLCQASLSTSAEIAAPLILLQLWVWTRFPVGRPIPVDLPPTWIGTYASIWLGHHAYRDTARYSISNYRRAFEELRDIDVNWTPYEDVMDHLPPICREDVEMQLWYYEGPLMWFWIVEMCTPQRVMRQFNRLQIIPPLPLHGPDSLHEIRHRNGRNIDWSLRHATYLQRWINREENIVAHENMFDETQWNPYMAWFNREGMRTIYWRSETARSSDRHPAPSTNIGLHRSFTIRAETVQQTVY